MRGICVKNDEKNERCNDDESTSGNSAPCLLSLPKISRDIPVILETNYSKAVLRFGMRLYEKGFIEENNETISQNLMRGADLWVKSISEDCEDESEMMMSIAEYDGDKEKIMLRVKCNIENAKVYNITKLLDLHKKNKRLAWIVLKSLRYTHPCYHVMSPCDFMEMVSYTEWMGYDDEEVVLAEALGDGMGIDDIEIITKKDVYKVFPRWSIEANYADWDKLVSNIDKNEMSDMEKALFDCALKIKEINNDLFIFANKNDSITPPNMGPFNFCAMCFFNPFNNTGSLEYRVINNMYQQQMECGEDDGYYTDLLFNPEDDIDYVEFYIKRIKKMKNEIVKMFEFIGEKNEM